MRANPKEPVFESASKTIVSHFVYAVLAPIAKILIRYGWSVRDFADVARWVFVKVFYSTPEFWRLGRPTALQGAIKTGLPRQLVRKLNDVPEPQQALFTQRQNFAYRVIEGWVNDPAFHVDGKPAPLPMRHRSAPSFNRLVMKYGNDVTVGAVLGDLCDVGCVSVKDGVATLVNQTYGINFLNEDKLTVSAYMLRRHGETVDHNLTNADLKDRRLHRVWFQTRIPLDRFKEARSYIEKQMVETARRTDQVLSRRFAHDERRQDTQYVEVGFVVCLYESGSSSGDDERECDLTERSDIRNRVNDRRLTDDGPIKE